MYFESSDGRYKVTVVNINGQQYYRLTDRGYWQGDFRAMETLLTKAGLTLADLERVDD